MTEAGAGGRAARHGRGMPVAAHSRIRAVVLTVNYDWRRTRGGRGPHREITDIALTAIVAGELWFTRAFTSAQCTIEGDVRSTVEAAPGNVRAVVHNAIGIVDIPCCACVTGDAGEPWTAAAAAISWRACHVDRVWTTTGEEVAALVDAKRIVKESHVAILTLRAREAAAARTDAALRRVQRRHRGAHASRFTVAAHAWVRTRIAATRVP